MIVFRIERLQIEKVIIRSVLALVLEIPDISEIYIGLLLLELGFVYFKVL